MDSTQPELPRRPDGKLDNLCVEIPYEPRNFQERVSFWATEAFGSDVAGDLLERQDRFLEEVFELLQSLGYHPGRINRLRRYVYNRATGEPPQEIGGVMLTMAALCQAAGESMMDAGEAELRSAYARIDKIRAKQAAKPKFQAEPIALEMLNELEQEQFLEFIAEAMGTNGFSQDEIDGFASGDITGLERDTAIRAVGLAFQAGNEGQINPDPTLRATLVGVLDAAIGRQADGLSKALTVREPDGDQIPVSGTLDLDALAGAIESNVAAELAALRYGYEHMTRVNASLRARCAAAGINTKE